jgi:hypothetical protein
MADLRALIRRLVGDREHHQALITTRGHCPDGPGEAQRAAGRISPRVRIYVACSRGVHGLVDDRDTLEPERERRVDIVEAEYADPAAVTAEDRLAGRVPCPSECKGQMMHLLAEDNRLRAPVDYVAFLDDDLELRVSDLLAGAEEAMARSCSIFQLQLTHDSHAVWDVLKAEAPSPESPDPGDPVSPWLELPFVEVMGPVIAQREIDRGLLAVLAPFRSGFGWDAYLLPLLGELFPDFRPGIYLGARMRHVRPLRTDPHRRFSNGLTPPQEEDMLRAALLLTLLTPRVLESRGLFLAELQRQLNGAAPELLHGLADALHSVSLRYWQCRHLEAVWLEHQRGGADQ